MIKYIFKFLCQIILYSIGWEHTFNTTKINKKCIIIYPHSSYFDYFLSVLYTSQINLEVYTIISERFLPFNIKGAISAPDKYMRYYMSKGYTKFQAFCECWKNTILGRKVDVENIGKTGYVEHVCNMLKDKENYVLLISPTGSITDTKWRSGYYHIAKKLNVPIIVAGIDYKYRTCVVSDVYHHIELDPSEQHNRLFDGINTYHTSKDYKIVNWSCLINIFTLFVKILKSIYSKEYYNILFYTIFNLHIYQYVKYNNIKDLLMFSCSKILFTYLSIIGSTCEKYVYMLFIFYHHFMNIVYPLVNSSNSSLELLYFVLVLMTNY